ncbi:MAG: LysM peptidoglycan-binding domain-containing protein [Cytophagales bacterium]|nr:LysM peptidoglycan-binding domain-containing protein [Rhizobacter sp.]
MFNPPNWNELQLSLRDDEPADPQPVAEAAPAGEEASLPDAPVATNPATPTRFDYPLGKGESLHEVAARYGMTLSQLRADNPGLPTDDGACRKLPPNTPIRIVIDEQHGAMPRQVRWGPSSTLSELAANVRLANHHDLARGHTFTAGQQIWIPGTVGAKPLPEPAVVTEEPAAATDPAPPEDPIKHEAGAVEAVDPLPEPEGEPDPEEAKPAPKTEPAVAALPVPIVVPSGPEAEPAEPANPAQPAAAEPAVASAPAKPPYSVSLTLSEHTAATAKASQLRADFNMKLGTDGSLKLSVAEVLRFPDSGPSSSTTRAIVELGKQVAKSEDFSVRSTFGLHYWELANLQDGGPGKPAGRTMSITLGTGEVSTAYTPVAGFELQLKAGGWGFVNPETELRTVALTTQGGISVSRGGLTVTAGALGTYEFRNDLPDQKSVASLLDFKLQVSDHLSANVGYYRTVYGESAGTAIDFARGLNNEDKIKAALTTTF